MQESQGKERKTRRVQLLLRPSLYGEAMRCGALVGHTSFAGVVEEALSLFCRRIHIEEDRYVQGK